MTPGAQVGVAAQWERRAQRAEELAGQHAATSEILQFYARILRLQGEIAAHAPPAKTDAPLRLQLNAAQITPYFPPLFAAIDRGAPTELRRMAHEVRERGEDYWAELIADVIQKPEPPGGTVYFFARVCAQPFAEAIARTAPRLEHTRQGACPWCDGWPMLALWRPEGDGGKRSLVCSFCLGEWEFRRILCPWCGEEDEKKLPRYSAEDLPAVHAAVCETCRKYVKTVDLTANGLAEPLVDDVATVALDLWAAQYGYQRLAANLFVA